MLLSLFVAAALAAPVAAPAAAPAPAGASAPASAPATILVVPFIVPGEDAQWAGVAAAEIVLDVVVQSNRDNFLTLKQLDSVLRRLDLHLADAGVPAGAQKLAHTLGASDIIVGEIALDGDALKMTARRLRVSDGATVISATQEGPKASLPILAQRIARTLLGTKGSSGVLTPHVQALELATRCELEMARFSLGPRTRSALPAERVASAEKHCSAALAIDPLFGLAKAGLAMVRAAQGKFSEARKQAEDAREDQGKARFLPLAVLTEAYAAARMGDDADARTLLEEAMEERPGFLHALGYLGEERLEAHDDADALKAFEQYLKRVPNHPWAMGRKAHAMARLGHRNEAIDLSEEALKLNPGDPELLIETASRYIDAGRDAKAEPLLKQARDATPPRPLASLRLGYLYFRGHKQKEAREELGRALELAHREDETKIRALAHADLARLDARQANFEGAIEELTKARKEGLVKLPCDEPELARWKARPELANLCSEIALAGTDPKADDTVPIDFE